MGTRLVTGGIVAPRLRMRKPMKYVWTLAAAFVLIIPATPVLAQTGLPQQPRSVPSLGSPGAGQSPGSVPSLGSPGAGQSPPPVPTTPVSPDGMSPSAMPSTTLPPINVPYGTTPPPPSSSTTTPSAMPGSIPLAPPSSSIYTR